MAKAGQAPVISPNKVVRIDAFGGVDRPVVTIPNGGIVEFRAITDQAWEIQFIDPDGADFYPLSIVVPAVGATYFVGNVQPDSDTCEYNVVPFLGGKAPGKPNRVMGNNKIVVGGNNPDTPKRRK
jgi:hypothetical protein